MNQAPPNQTTEIPPLIANQADVTPAVLRAMADTPDPRLAQIMAALVRHAHAFIREVRPTPQEYERALQFVAGLGHHTTDVKNEVVLCADVLGLSTLVDLLNHHRGQGETMPALLGPFYRGNAPECQAGACIARADTPGAPLFVSGQVRSRDGRPLAGALLDVWQASPVGLYENQDADQPDMNLRGRFRADHQGRYHFRSVHPKGYPVPTDGPVGDLLAAQRRHPYRPAHLHFIVSAPGHRTLITQIFSDDPRALATDVAFGALAELVAEFVRHDAPVDGIPADTPVPYYTVATDFVLEPGVPSFPTPPIP